MRVISLILIFLFCITNVSSGYPFEKDALRIPMSQREIFERMGEAAEALYEDIQCIIDNMRGAGQIITGRSMRRYSWEKDLTTLVWSLQVQLNLEGLRKIEQALEQALPEKSKFISKESILSKKIRLALSIVRKAIRSTERRLSSQRRHTPALDYLEREKKMVERAVSKVADWLVRHAQKGRVFFEKSGICIGKEYIEEPLTSMDFSFYDVRAAISDKNPNLDDWQIEIFGDATKEDIVQLLNQATGLVPIEGRVLTVPAIQDKANRLIESLASQTRGTRSAGKYILYSLIGRGESDPELLSKIGEGLKNKIKLLKAALRSDPDDISLYLLVESVSRSIKRIKAELRKVSRPVRPARTIRSGV